MLDYLSLDADASAEERLIQETAREFVADRVAPDIGDWYEAGEFPEHLVAAMGDLAGRTTPVTWLGS